MCADKDSMKQLFIVVRAVTYAALFIGLVLIYLPGRFLSWSGIIGPVEIGAPQIVGMIVGGVGAAVALWCLSTFVFIGKGTPRAFRSAAPTRDSGALPVCAKSHVHWRRARADWRGALLSVVEAPGLHHLVLSFNASVRRVVRGADVAANFWGGVRSVL
jgi:hypothetical protein